MASSRKPGENRSLSQRGQEPEAPALASSQVQQFLDIQAQEVGLRRDENTLRRLEMEQGGRFAEKQLEAQERFIANEQHERRKARRDGFIFVAIVLLLVAAFFLVLLFLGKDEFAEEAMKALLFFFTGGTGGYFAGKAKGRNDPMNSPPADRQM